jgi:hypothetical protein
MRLRRDVRAASHEPRLVVGYGLTRGRDRRVLRELRVPSVRPPGDPVDLLLHDRDTGQAPEAEHPDAEPDCPEAGDESDRKSCTAEPARAPAVRGDEDRALGPLGCGDSLSLDDCHRIHLKHALDSA